MIFFTPEKDIGCEKISHLMPTVIKNECPPIRMRTFFRVFMLIEGSPVKLNQAVSVSWEMGRNPINDNSDIVLMTVIYKIHEVFGCAESACGGKISCYLITPGCIKRMLHNRHKLDMRISHIFYIVNQEMGNLPVCQKSITFLSLSCP